MSVPFVRQLPNRRVLQQIDLMPTFEDAARDFIAHGGRYLIEILGTGQVRLAACLLDGNGQQRDVEVIITDNGKGLTQEVEKLIVASIRHVGTGETRH